MTWVALHRQLVLTGIYLWVSGSDAIGPNLLIGSFVHFGGAPRRASRTLLGIHVLGAPVGALVSLGDALIWIGAPPMLVLLGVLSNLGGFLHLPDRYRDPACWKVIYLMPALPAHRLDIIGGSATSSLLALDRSSRPSSFGHFSR